MLDISILSSNFVDYFYSLSINIYIYTPNDNFKFKNLFNERQIRNDG